MGLRKALGIVLLLGALAFLFSGRSPRAPFRAVAPIRAVGFAHRERSAALIAAVYAGDLKRVERLLDRGVSPDSIEDLDEGNVKGNVEADSALQVAAYKGNLPLAKLLLDHGADVNAPDFFGGNAATSAAVSGQPEVLDLLIERGADVSADDDGANALGYAEHGLREAKSPTERARFQRVVDSLKRAGA